MNALIVSDLHAHAWTRFATTLPDGTNSRFAVLLDVLDQVGRYIDEYNPDSLIVLGDVTHRRYFVNFSVYNKLMAKLEELRTKISGVRDRRSTHARGIMVVGNHDYESVGVHSLTPFQYAGWTVVDKPKHLPEGFFVPWMPDNQVTEAVSRPRSFGNIFLHYALDGHVLDSEFALPSPLRLDDLSEYRTIVMGHIHSPSVEQDGRVTYVGAPMHFDFGDVGDRFCWLMDVDAGKLTPLLLHAPQFITTAYPKVPMPAEPGYLRILNVPARQSADVKNAAIKNGWLDAVPIDTAIPAEAVKALSSSVIVDRDIMANYVTRQYPDLDDESRTAILQFGLDCLERNQ